MKVKPGTGGQGQMETKRYRRDSNSKKSAICGEKYFIQQKFYDLE
jgi:hypothetical protein